MEVKFYFIFFIPEIRVVYAYKQLLHLYLSHRIENKFVVLHILCMFNGCVGD